MKLRISSIILLFLCIVFVFFAALSGFIAHRVMKLNDELNRICGEEIVVDDFLKEEYIAKQLDTPEPPERKTYEVTDKAALYRYRSCEGISFISYSQAWNEDMLYKLYEELLRNAHGDELGLVAKVVVYPQSDEFAAATHQSEESMIPIGLTHHSFPEHVSVKYREETGIITLYDGDRKTTVEGMAHSLSHEYGHHYTIHHMFGGDTNGEELLESEYARIRALDPEKGMVDRSDTQFYYDNHMWYLLEIAAEDYVALMGSPNSRKSYDVSDVYEHLRGEDSVWEPVANSNFQENLLIPASSEVPGLAEYFYSFIDETMPEFDENKDMNVSVAKGSETYLLETGIRTFTHYKITFDKSYGEDATYTVISYEKDNYNDSLTIIRTVCPGEDPIAYIGELVIDKGDYLSYADDMQATGTKTFIVTVVTEDGRMYHSDPIDYTF